MSDRHPQPSAADRVLPATLDGDAAVDLLFATTGPSQTVIDFDDDHVLRAAAHAIGRRYRALPLRLQTRRAPAPQEPDADLITLAWPRPHDPTPTASAQALTVAAGLLLPGGHVALLLEPSVPQAYTITWTGAVLAAAHDAGLDYLQDVICLHHEPDDPPARPAGDTGPVGDTGPAGRSHRVVLILRRQAGRHA